MAQKLKASGFVVETIMSLVLNTNIPLCFCRGKISKEEMLEKNCLLKIDNLPNGQMTWFRR